MPDREPQLGVRSVYWRLARNSAYLAAGTAASAVFMMMAAVLNARGLSARNFGLLVLFQSATTMVATFMSFSTQQPVIKLGSSALADGDMAKLGGIIRLGLLVDFFAALAAASAALAFITFGRRLIGIDEEHATIALLFAISLLFTGYLTSNGILRLLDRFGLLSLVQTGCAAGLFAATLFLYESRAPFEAYCWTWAIFYAVNYQLPLALGLWLAHRAGVQIANRAAMGSSELSTFLAYCWTTWGTATAEALRSNGDSLLVGAIVSVEGAGIYNVAKQLAGIVRKLSTVYGSAAFPEISTLSALGQEESANRVRKKMLLVSGVVGVIAILAALVFGHWVLSRLFGSHFDAAYVPLIILTAAAASQLISYTLSMYVQVYVGPERLFWVYLIAISVFVVAVVPLTSALSMSGAAAAQLLFSVTLIYFCNSALRGARR